MKKGLIALFAAVALSGVSTTFASAPIISNLPDIIISEQEDNVGATDNNFFVYTNAFKFDNFVNDDSTTESGLAWSFDEGDSPNGPARWFKVNGLDSVHAGTTEMTGDVTAGYAAHKSPTGNELRSGNVYASFRDIVFTPGTGGLPGAKQGEPVADHSMGKIVQFYVSDGTTVTASNLITVRTINNVTVGIGSQDFASGGSQFIPLRADYYKDKFIGYSQYTNGQFGGSWPGSGNTSGWYVSGDDMPGANMGLGQGMSYDYDSTYQALRVRVYTASTTVVSGTTYGLRTRNGGWYCNQGSGSEIDYAQVGTGNVARGKFWVFYQPTTGGVTTQNHIPGFAMRVSSGYALVSNLEITGHSNDLGFVTSANPGGAIYTEDQRYSILNPTSNPQKPSMYRVDYKPINVTGVSALPITRSFNVLSTFYQDEGYLELAECIIGIYPAALIDTTGKTPMKSFTGTEVSKNNSDVKLWNGRIPAGVTTMRSGEPIDGNEVSNNSTPNNGGTAVSDAPSATDLGANGITFNTAACVTTKVGIVEDMFLVTNGIAEQTATIATLPRVSAGKQYVVRFHLNSTQQSQNQSNLWLYTRTNGFSYIQKTEFGGGRIGLPSDEAYLKNAYPGLGSATAGVAAYYDVLVVTPLQASIRPEYVDNGKYDATNQALSVGMKSLFESYGPGSTTRGYRDLNLGLVCLDTLNVLFPQAGGPYNPAAVAESTQISCDGAQVFEFDQVLD